MATMLKNDGKAPHSRALSDRRRAHVRDAVVGRQVRYEVRPEYDFRRDHSLVCTGFEVLLVGSHGSDHHWGPPCRECRAILEDLKEVALATVPPDDRENVYEVIPDDRAVRFSRARGFRAEVGLRLRVLSRRVPIPGMEDMPAYRAVMSTLEALGVPVDRTNVELSSTGLPIIVQENEGSSGRLSPAEGRASCDS